MRPTGRRVRWRESSSAGIPIGPLSGSSPTGTLTHQSFPYKHIWIFTAIFRLMTPITAAGQLRSEDLSLSLQANIARGDKFTSHQITAARRAFYALCTHIDHQLRVLLGTLREEGELDNTIICFTSDHGDMLGNHGMWAKRLFLRILRQHPDDPARRRWG